MKYGPGAWGATHWRSWWSTFFNNTRVNRRRVKVKILVRYYWSFLNFMEEILTTSKMEFEYEMEVIIVTPLFNA